MNIPVRTKQKKKTLRAKQIEGGKLTKTNINIARFGFRLSRFFLCCVYIFLLLFFFLFLIIIFSLACFSLFFLPAHFSLARFCLSRLSSNVDITLAYFFEGACTAYRNQFEALGKFRKHSNKVAKRSPIS